MQVGEEIGVEHRCRAGKKCSARSEKQAAITSRPDTLCPACIESVQQARNKLEHIRDAVRIFICIKPVSVLESKVSSSKEPMSPLNLVAETLFGDIDDVLGRVGGYLVRDLVSQPSKRFKVWRGEVEQLVFWDGVDLALQIKRVYDRGVALLGFEPRWQRRAAPCWACNLPCLGQFTGSETVECSSCGARKTDADYQAYCIELARGK